LIVEVKMANKPGRLSLALYDGIGGGGNLTLHANIPEATTLTALATALALLKTNYLTIGGAGIKNATFSFFDDTLAVAPSNDQRVGSGGVFDFSAGDPVTTYGNLVPALNPALVSADGSIDISSGDSAAWVAYLLAGPGVGDFSNAAYSDLIAGIDGFSTNRKRRRRLRI
jgi:hypothetical protein